MKKLLMLALPVLVVACSEAPTTSPNVDPAFAAGGQGGPRPRRGDVTGATPDVFSAAWITGVSEDGGAKGQSLAMTDFAYYSFRNWWDHDISSIKKIEASFLAGAGTVNGGGSPRFSLELDVNGDGSSDCDGYGELCTVDANIFLAPEDCSDLAQSGWRNSDFTGDRTNCSISDTRGNTFVSDAAGTAWSKVVAYYAGSKVWFMFLVQDATSGTNYVDRIKLDAAFFTNAP